MSEVSEKLLDAPSKAFVEEPRREAIAQVGKTFLETVTSRAYSSTMNQRKGPSPSGSTSTTGVSSTITWITSSSVSDSQ